MRFPSLAHHQNLPGSDCPALNYVDEIQVARIDLGAQARPLVYVLTTMKVV